MAIVLLRQPAFVVACDLPCAASRSGFNKECHYDTTNAVKEDQETAENVKPTADSHDSSDERIMDDESRKNQDDHANEVDPVRDNEWQRMSLFVMS